jgi:hypothetical protein
MPCTYRHCATTQPPVHVKLLAGAMMEPRPKKLQDQVQDAIGCPQADRHRGLSLRCHAANPYSRLAVPARIRRAACLASAAESRSPVTSFSSACASARLPNSAET